MLACTESGTLSRTFTVLCTQQRWCRAGKDFVKRLPEAKRAIANGNFRGRFATRAASRRSEAHASSAALPDADLKANQFLLAFRRRADQHQHALAVVFHACLQEDAIGPHIARSAARQVALLPALVLALPLRPSAGR